MTEPQDAATPSAHTRTARLPLGFRATFRFSPTAGIEVAWSPALPTNIESKRAFRRFFRAYAAERDAFLRDVATILRITVAVVDVGSPKLPELGGCTTIRPESIH
jgi:hypothetical protein